MTNKHILPVAIAILTLVGVACNSSSDSEYSYDYSSSVRVTSFYLAQNDSIVDSLQNVFFTIDLGRGLIYNADSLPYGTDVSRCVTTLTTETTMSAVTIEFPRENMTDSIVDYLSSSTDSIDYSLGPVKLRVVSYSGLVEMVYTISVNVHQQEPDTLAWSDMAVAELPTTFSSIDAQCTACLDGVYYTLTQSGGNYCLATTTDPDAGDWTTSSVTFDFTPDVNSLRTSDSALYILDTDGLMYQSTDFASWQSTGELWSFIYGGYEDNVLGCSMASGSWRICSYPDGEDWTMPARFPISGTSLPCVYKTSMALSSQLIMLGGRDAEGELLNTSWSFDGNTWRDIANAALPDSLECMSMVAYDLFYVTSSTWVPVEYPALVALGGKDDEEINRIVYYSTDWGMTWREAPELMQLPEEMESFYGVSSFVYSIPMYTSRAASSIWQPINIKPLPSNCRFVDAASSNSRVTAAITEWEVPSIYIFGPTLESGRVSNQVLRARIQRYTNEPVY